MLSSYSELPQLHKLYVALLNLREKFTELIENEKVVNLICSINRKSVGIKIKTICNPDLEITIVMKFENDFYKIFNKKLNVMSK
ncbi:hypothetical protein [Thermohalobacter berrensis]|nr:hypothetical protein [Thermohalobacter berrensis]